MKTCSGRKRWVFEWAKPVDRDALLALAEEMAATSMEIRDSGSIRAIEAAFMILCYARRIREACGEAEHGR